MMINQNHRKIRLKQNVTWAECQEQKSLESSAEGRDRRCRRNLRWQAVPHLRASNRKCSAINSAEVNRRQSLQERWSPRRLARSVT